MPGPDELFGPDPRREKALEDTLKPGETERQTRELLERLDKKAQVNPHHKEIEYRIAGSAEEELERKELHRRRYLRAQEIVEWISKMWAHQMEPPTVQLYLDGSGSFYVGEKTLESMRDHGREQLEKAVGSSRWEAVLRMETGYRYRLHFCHLRLDTEVGT